MAGKILIVKDEIPEEVSFNETYMTRAEFADVGSYPWIKANIWDKIIIDVNGDYPQNVISVLKDIYKIEFRMYNEDWTDEQARAVIRNVAELHPDKTVILRQALLRERDKLASMVKEIINEQ